MTPPGTPINHSYSVVYGYRRADAGNSTGNPAQGPRQGLQLAAPSAAGRGQSGPGCSVAGGFGGAVPEAGWAALDGPAAPAWAGVSRRGLNRLRTGGRIITRGGRFLVGLDRPAGRAPPEVRARALLKIEPHTPDPDQLR